VAPSTAGSIIVLDATYGGSCGATPNNVLAPLASCNGTTLCTYTVDFDGNHGGPALGDPTPGCAKDYVAHYNCGPGTATRTVSAPAEAGYGSRVALSCGTPAPTIVVLDATYGGSCGVTPNNVLAPLEACNGQAICTYTVDYDGFHGGPALGDPAYGCAKDYVAHYNCGPGTATKTASAPAEAGLGSRVTLSCP
jgi:hypothetical protein